MNFAYWFLVFYIISILGYICEVVYCYIIDKKIINRGFMFGPYCPIYGVGAIGTVILFNEFYNNPIMVFILGMLLCSIIEYITSYLMEKLFNDKWWDYSDNKYNINGRVCLKNSVLFGISSLALIYIIYPLIEKLIFSLSLFILNILAVILFGLFLIDFIFTIINILKLRRQLSIIDKIRNEIENEISDLLQSNINKYLKYNRYQKHIINVFPNMKSRYENNIRLLNEFSDNKL